MVGVAQGLVLATGRLACWLLGLFFVQKNLSHANHVIASFPRNQSLLSLQGVCQTALHSPVDSTAKQAQALLVHKGEIMKIISALNKGIAMIYQQYDRRYGAKKW